VAGAVPSFHHWSPSAWPFLVAIQETASPTRTVAQNSREPAAWVHMLGAAGARHDDARAAGAGEVRSSLYCALNRRCTMPRKRWTPQVLKRLNEQWLVVVAPWDMPEGSHDLDGTILIIDGRDYRLIGGEVDDRPLAKGERIQIRVEPVKYA
jgi:hypothetical protein